MRMIFKQSVQSVLTPGGRTAVVASVEVNIEPFSASIVPPHGPQAFVARATEPYTLGTLADSQRKAVRQATADAFARALEFL